MKTVFENTFGYGDIIAIFVAFITALALVLSIQSDRNDRKRDYQLRSYEQLAHLSIVVFQNIENKRRRLDQARKASSPDEATELLGSYMTDTVDEVTRALHQLDLNRFSMDEETFVAIKGGGRDVEKHYNRWHEAAQKGQATADQIFAYTEALDAFWDQMRETVDSSLGEIARQLRL